MYEVLEHTLHSCMVTMYKTTTLPHLHATRCANEVHELVLQGCHKLTGAGVIPFLERTTALKSVDLRLHGVDS